MEAIELNATYDQVDEFKQSVLWQDIVRELKMWKESFELERNSIVDNAADDNPSTASVLMHLGDINGRIKAVEYMLSIPDVFLSILEEKKEAKAAEQEETPKDS